MGVSPQIINLQTELNYLHKFKIGDHIDNVEMMWGWWGWCRDDGDNMGTMWGQHGDNVGTTWGWQGGVGGGIWGCGDDMGTIGKMWRWHGDDRDNRDDVGTMWGPQGQQISKNTITLEQIEIILNQENIFLHLSANFWLKIQNTHCYRHWLTFSTSQKLALNSPANGSAVRYSKIWNRLKIAP